MTKDYIKRQFSNYNSQVAKPQANSIAFDVAKDIEGVEVTEKFVPLELEIENKFVRQGGGVWITNQSSAKGASIQVSEGDKYRITSTYKYGSTPYALFNGSQKVYVYPTQGDNSPLTNIKEIVTIPNGVTELRVSSNANTPLIVEKAMSLNGLEIKPTTDYLYGKKWAACGDSFTAGDFSGYVDTEGKSGIESDAYDPIKQMYKTYPWWIANRNNMSLSLLAVAGNDFTNVEGAVRPFSNANITNYSYAQIPTDCDYITLMFGLNESELTTEQIGTKTDSDNTTLWGAYNVVLEDILTKNPAVKIGIIIEDAWLSRTYHDALIEIAKYWGIPYLDLRNSENVPMLINGRLDEINTTAKTLRDNAFRVSSTNPHPSVKGHEYRSTIIENFLRSL